MDEYIKREAVIKGFTDLLQKPGDIYPTDITTMMQRVPAADVWPVVRGQWDRLELSDKWQCSVCGVLMDIDGTPQENLLNFCPNCGSYNGGDENG